MMIHSDDNVIKHHHCNHQHHYLHQYHNHCNHYNHCNHQHHYVHQYQHNEDGKRSLLINLNTRMMTRKEITLYTSIISTIPFLNR